MILLNILIRVVYLKKILLLTDFKFKGISGDIMRVEIPECTRCCICIPLRYGIIVFGYLNLGFSIFVLVMESWMRFRREVDLTEITMVLHSGVMVLAPVWFTLLLYILQIVLNIVLLVGAYMRKPHLMRVYYYFSISTVLAALVCYVLNVTQIGFDMIYYYLLEISFIISGVVMQVYLLLLIRSELAKLEQRTRWRFTNQAHDVFVDAKVDDIIDF